MVLLFYHSGQSVLAISYRSISFLAWRHCAGCSARDSIELARYFLLHVKKSVEKTRCQRHLVVARIVPSECQTAGLEWRAIVSVSKRENDRHGDFSPYLTRGMTQFRNFLFLLL
ncbi:hypothetical protein CEXT_763301 [Caerostris extrusa]|uniref:Secreted protein n=1 Tax=Caerostris extrusa TaxID=172846 RepID=A0AAV4P804_CAEEX|nr:hypothetical protein CEXT_763301 [Caerostris extrusa]